MTIDLRDLIIHRIAVQAEQTLESVYQCFACHHQEFMAVLDGGRLVGMCARRDLGMLLGSRYGFSLYAHKRVREHLMPHAVVVRVGTPIVDVFRSVFSRGRREFYDDVLLVTAAGEFLGLIDTQTLVKLQNRFHLENIGLLENQKRELKVRSDQLEADLRMSRELQRALLPGQYPVFPPQADPRSSAIRFQHQYHPCGIVGGDFFHITRVTDTVAGVFIADVMGHGVCSALGTAMLRALLEELIPEVLDPGELLGSLNGELAKILRQVGNDPLFVTALYLLIDSGNLSVSYATAGHPYPIHVRPRANIVEPMLHPDPGVVLGLFDEFDFRTHEKPVCPADSIILFTDGIIEIEDAHGREFGVEGLLETARSEMNRPTGEILEALMERARQFSATREFTDDVCLLAVDLNGASSS